MDDLMARTMVENLSIGIDPLTGRALSPRDCCANGLVQEALKMVLDNCSLESYGTILERRREERRSAKSAWPSGIPTPARPGRRKKTGTCMICMYIAVKTSTR